MDKKAFNSVPNEWILKVQKMLKVSPIIFAFLKYNMKIWYNNSKLIHEKGGMLKTYYLNINNGIFQGD